MLASILPLIILAGLVIYFTSGGATTFTPTGVAPAPVEKLDIERIVLRRYEIAATVINSGPSEVTIAQIQVNGGTWPAQVSPTNILPRLGRATIRLEYEWVDGEPLEITVITSNGLKFSRHLEVATLTPSPDSAQFFSLALAGAYAGVIPVFLGLAWLPFLSRITERWSNFLLTFTVGLLLFIGIEAAAEALELAGRIPVPFQGVLLASMAFIASFLILEAIGTQALARAKFVRATPGLMLALLIALGIGLHNLGEGLAIGAAYALGELSLGALLIVGFMIHNTTEGVAILAPVSHSRVPLPYLAGMGLIAGMPTILGTWVGGFTTSEIWSVVFLAIGSGAVFQVVYEILSLMGKSPIKTMSNSSNLAGLLLGLLVMYVTGLLLPL